MAPSEIEHFTHPHVLHKQSEAVAFYCNGCNTASFGISYQCSACEYNLHEECATSPFTVACHHHPEHHLILVNRPLTVLPNENGYQASSAGLPIKYSEDSDAYSSQFGCDVCGKRAYGLTYICPPCVFDVHPLCVNKKQPVAVQPCTESTRENLLILYNYWKRVESHKYKQHPEYDNNLKQAEPAPPQPEYRKRDLALAAGKIGGKFLFDAFINW